ncbi:helix-turn-helix transcriptional regulator [Yeosuana sp. MJ-SS3]|uniref:Helix-turn-helix transcriptional regulator n=1 Tax=Gilvirhabdus luticola TaxID=3079858 RepID=A0ABU3U7E2_9FLAO|nr:helix-turn-helix transcriptional regulator [Yeosuana sp. MJ-SS3]MDU8886306.1 helix-turn-helix transcriptional regulator [Yeosuana sp. MJ-SS3]
MIQARFVDDSTIEVTAQDGEKFTWNTYFPVPKQNQQYYAGRFPYYYQKYFEDNINMSLSYWIWIKMNYDEGLGIFGGKGDKEEERIFLNHERVRIGARIRELRKEKYIDAKKLAEAANIDAANLSRIEQGRYSVGLDILSKIALALGVKLELIDFVEPKKS